MKDAFILRGSRQKQRKRDAVGECSEPWLKTHVAYGTRVRRSAVGDFRTTTDRYQGKHHVDSTRPHGRAAPVDDARNAQRSRHTYSARQADRKFQKGLWKLNERRH